MTLEAFMSYAFQFVIVMAILIVFVLCLICALSKKERNNGPE